MKRIFFLEDHAFYAQALSLTLDGSVELVLANTLAEAREALRTAEGPFDLAIFDLQLPDGDGSEMVPEFRERFPGTPAVVLSAREDVEEAARAAGADEAVRKDRSLPDILAALERLLG